MKHQLDTTREADNVAVQIIATMNFWWDLRCDFPLYVQHSTQTSPQIWSCQCLMNLECRWVVSKVSFVLLLGFFSNLFRCQLWNGKSWQTYTQFQATMVPRTTSCARKINTHSIDSAVVDAKSENSTRENAIAIKFLFWWQKCIKTIFYHHRTEKFTLVAAHKTHTFFHFTAAAAVRRFFMNSLCHHVKAELSRFYDVNRSGWLFFFSLFKVL